MPLHLFVCFCLFVFLLCRRWTPAPTAEASGALTAVSEEIWRMVSVGSEGARSSSRLLATMNLDGISSGTTLLWYIKKFFHVRPSLSLSFCTWRKKKCINGRNRCQRNEFIPSALMHKISGGGRTRWNKHGSWPTLLQLVAECIERKALGCPSIRLRVFRIRRYLATDGEKSSREEGGSLFVSISLWRSANWNKLARTV